MSYIRVESEKPLKIMVAARTMYRRAKPCSPFALSRSVRPGHPALFTSHESGNARQASPSTCQILVNGLNGACAFSHGSRHSLDGATAHIASGKDAGPARFEIMRRSISVPLFGGSGACQHKPVPVQGDTIAKPPGIGLSPKKKENLPNGLVFELPLPVPPDCLESRLTA